MFNLCHNEDKIKWEPTVSYQYTLQVKVVIKHKMVNTGFTNNNGLPLPIYNLHQE